jgi:hypothetical protein
VERSNNNAPLQDSSIDIFPLVDPGWMLSILMPRSSHLFISSRKHSLLLAGEDDQWNLCRPVYVTDLRTQQLAFSLGAIAQVDCQPSAQ